MEPCVAPHAAAGCAKWRDGAWELWGAAADEKVTRAFDLASISKTFTALCTCSLVAQSRLSWVTPLERLLPESRGTWAGGRSVEELLSHRAGLVPHREFFARSWRGAPLYLPEMIRCIADSKGPQDPATAVYSDLGYILVGLGLEATTNAPLDSLIETCVSRPWGLRVGSSRSFFSASSTSLSSVAVTEIQPRRGGLLHGLVHDDNAWMLSGFGCSGHAGLFGDLEALLRLGCWLLSRHNDRSLEPLTRSRPGGSLLLGLDSKSPTRSTAGERCSSRTFGHLGFTGTSFWCDPESQRVTVLLTNRVHPTRKNQGLQGLRSKIHDFLWEC